MQKDGFYTDDYKDVEDLIPADISKELHPLWVKLNIIPNDAIIDSTFRFSDNVNLAFHFYGAVKYSFGVDGDKTPPKCITENLQYSEEHIFKKCKLLKEQIYLSMLDCEEISFGYCIKKPVVNDTKVDFNKLTKRISDTVALKFDSNGMVHCDDGPAITDNEIEIWYTHGTLHRKDGPAIISQPRLKYFKKEGGWGTLLDDNGKTIMTPPWEQWWENGVRIK
jgi:hypothetical protein